MEERKQQKNLEDFSNQELYSELVNTKKEADLLIARALLLLQRTEASHPYRLVKQELTFSFKSLEAKEKEIEEKYASLFVELNKRLDYEKPLTFF